MTLQTIAPFTIDRDGMVAWYRRNRARSRALFDLLADEAYYSQPIALRHPIVFYEGHLPGVQLQHAGQESGSAVRASMPARGAVRARHRSGRGGRSSQQAVQWPSRDVVRQFAAEADRRVIERCDRRPRSARASAARSRRGGVRHPRARGDAPGNAALHVAPAAARSEARAAAGYRPRVERASPPAGVDRGARRPRDARRRSRTRFAFGWDNEFPRLPPSVDAVCDRAPRRDERRVPRVRRGGRLRRAAMVAAGGLARGCRPKRVRTRSSGSASDGAWQWRGMFDSFRCRLPGRCTSATPRPRRTRAGAAHACRPRPSFSAPPTGRRDGRAAASLGRRATATRVTACSISRAGIPSRPAVIPQGRAPGASTTSSATAGSGRARRSRRFPASARWRRTRSTRPISSTASTSS